MVVVLLALEDAEPLRNILLRGGFSDLVRQLDVQLPHERLLPTDARPCFVYRFEDTAVGGEIYDPDLARAMYDGLEAGAKAHHDKLNDTLPLFADRESVSA